jgi:4-hydroxy-tetrahydrodipicolinate reductase
MTKLIILGAAGRMGISNIQCAVRDSGVKVVGAVEHSNSSFINKDAGVTAGCSNIGYSITDKLSEVISSGDVVIDFTSPSSTLAALEANLYHKKGFIIGTTGLSDEDKSKVTDYSKSFPIVFSPNFSIGVNVLFKLTELASSLLNKDKDYDLEIIEAHHRFKKDAPSGTALKLGDIAAKHSGRTFNKDVIYGRRGITGERSIDEMAMHTIRGGDIIGDHKLIFCTMGERVEIGHIAHNRETFSKGVILAAKWLKSHTNGLFSMFDVLDI